MIRKLDFVGIPTRDPERARAFYVDTLGLTPDDNAPYEVWLGQTCLAIWEPERFGMPFQPQKNAHLALEVEDVEASRRDLEEKGIEFLGETIDGGACKMALFTDPDGNDLMLHHRYAPYD